MSGKTLLIYVGLIDVFLFSGEFEHHLKAKFSSRTDFNKTLYTDELNSYK